MIKRILQLYISLEINNFPFNYANINLRLKINFLKIKATGKSGNKGIEIIKLNYPPATYPAD